MSSHPGEVRMRLYQRENQLPGIDLITNTNRLRTQIQSDTGETSAPELTISDIRYKPGTSCLVAYRSVPPLSDAREFVHAKAFTRNHWPAACEKLRGADNRIRLMDDLCVAIFPFPFDSDLPALRQWTSSPQHILSRTLYNSPDAAGLDSWRILAYKPHRRITLKLQMQQCEPVVLKFHDQHSFPRVLRSQRMARRTKTVCPGRIGRSNRYRALANQWIPGQPLTLAKRIPRDVEDLFTQVLDHTAEINRTVDSMSLWSGPAFQFRELCEYLQVLFPPVTPVFQKVLRQIAELDGPPGQLVFCHGDFHERQLIVNDAGLRAIDFDNGCAGDATTDAANFVAHVIYQSCVNGKGTGMASMIRQLAEKKFRDWSSLHLTSFRVNTLKALARMVTTPFRSGHPCWMTQTEKVLGLLESMASEALRNHSFAESGKPKHRDATTCANQVCVKSVTQSRSRVLIDPQLPCLEALQDLEEAQSILRDEVPELAKRFGEFSLDSALPLRHKPGRRCLIKYCLSNNKGSWELLGKASTKNTYGKVCKMQSHMYRDLGFDASSVDQISVPRVLGTCDRWRMWFQDSVPARSAGYLLNANRKVDGTLLAKTFTKLHQSGFVISRTHSVDDELDILAGRLKEHIHCDRPLARRTRSVLESCQRIARNVSRHVERCIHRDLYQDQVLISGNRVWLVDLDTLSMGHPAIDVGNFVAHLVEHGIRYFGNPGHWKRLSTQLTGDYQELNPDVSPSDIDALTTISLARHIAICHDFPERRIHMPEIVAEVERRLRDGGQM